MLENAKDFAVNVIKVCNGINKGPNAAVLTKQLIRSGTSIGANIHEAKYGYGSSDFTFKLQIALKECYESEYWLELLGRTGLITEESSKALSGECGRIRRMLISAINKMKSKEE
ncbi:MAG: four helix bundle protein [Clostridia bacterium]|nr:four helix bundle protein [Clostridia bacterium]MBR5769810.1 four helix bundle protein [Clostridia bacterium]